MNSPGYQTEYIGGDFVPAMTVNSNLIPVYGQERLEILRDGASAIYGADAVAGVVNHVLQSDFEGFMIRGKRQQYDHFMAEDTTVTAKFGMDFNNGATNVGVFFDHYDRGKIRAMEDERWGAGDLRPLIPQYLGADSPWIGQPVHLETPLLIVCMVNLIWLAARLQFLAPNMTEYGQIVQVNSKCSQWEMKDVLIGAIPFMIQVTEPV